MRWIFTLFLFIPALMDAQQSFPTYRDSVKFKAFESWHYGNGFLFEFSEYSYTYDTTFCNQLYDVITLEDHKFYLRSDSVRVYFRHDGITSNLNCSDPEKLAYDFSLEKDDTISVNEFHLNFPIRFTALSVDTVEINGIKRKRIEIDALTPPHYWIEGIGSTMHPFRFMFHDGVNTVWNTLCVDSSGTMIYQRTENCDTVYYTSTGPEFEWTNELRVFPNPSNGSVTIQSPVVFRSLTMKVYNSMGKCVRFEKVHEVSELKLELPNEAGSYFMELTDERANRRTKILIREQKCAG